MSPVSRERHRPRTGEQSRRVGLAVAAFVAAIVTGFVVRAGTAVLLEFLLRDPDSRTVLGTLPGVCGSLAVCVLGVGYVRWRTDEPSVLAACHARRPSLREVGLAVGGVAGHYLALFWGLVAFTLVGVSVAGGIDESSTDAALLLSAVASVFVVAPGEELVSRRILQDALVGVVGRTPGIVAASVAFALPHLVVRYTGPGALLAVALTGVGGLVYGYLYERTDNLTVPVLAHGAFNAINYLLNYAGI